MMLENVLPAIKSGWPRSESKIISVQQDNASPHIPTNDPDVVSAGLCDGW